MWKPLISLPLFSEGLFITCCSSGDIKSEGTSPVRGGNFDQQAMFMGHTQPQRALRFLRCKTCLAWTVSADASGALGGEDDLSSDSWTRSRKVLSPG